MSDNKTAWDNLDIRTKAWVMQQAVRGGFSKDLNEIRELYNTVDSLNNVAKQQNPNIIQRLNQNNPKTIEDWEDPTRRASYKMGSYGNRVIGIVQQDSTGNLVDYSNPINHKGSNKWDAAIKSAEQNKDYVEFGNPKHAEIYGQFYKMSYPQHFMPKKEYCGGGPTSTLLDIFPTEYTPNQQYLDFQNYNNKVMQFGFPNIKIPNRDQDAYFYNTYLNFNENNPTLIDNNYNADYSFDMDCTGLKGCARYVTKIFEGANGNISKQSGVFSDAWKMPKLIESSGGNIIYNIYDDDFKNISDVQTLKRKTEEKLKNNPVNIKDLQIGDVVGIYNPYSTMHTKALNEGTTKNTHVGIVYAFDEDNMPLIRHLVGDKELKDRADNLGNFINDSKISVVARPKFTNLKPIIFKPKSSRFYIKDAIPEMIQYMDSIEGAMDIIGQFYSNANMEEVAKAAIAIMKRETNYGKNTISKQLDRGEILPKIKNMARNIAYKIKNKNEENISSNFSKFKLSTLTPDERIILGINTTKDLEDPQKAGIASLYILSKNYDYLKRYAMQNPNLGITDDDILNATILSYNQGMGKLYSLGSDEEGFPKPEELQKLRYLSDYNNKIYDINSTNYKYLGPLGTFMYEKLEDPNVPYIGSARKEMENTIKYKKDLTYFGAHLPEVEVIVKKPELHNFRLFDEGGPIEGEYNIFEDPKSFGDRDQHRQSLDAFVKNNPKLYGLNTADFVDFLSQIAGLESGYRSKATNNASTYSGYYGLKNGHTFDADTQHKKAFQHLSKIFKENITKQDIDKANSLGITPAQLLAKYWNQGNRVTNYLYNNIDNEDALGTKISKYGWNVTAPVEYKDLVPEAITDGYIIIKDAKSLPDGIVRARNNSIDYSNREKSILQLNDSINPYGFTVTKFNPNKLQKGQKVKLMSDDERETKLLIQKIMDSYKVDNLINNPYSRYVNKIMNPWKQ